MVLDSMKETIHRAVTILFAVLLVVVLLITGCWYCWNASWHHREKKYYSNQEHFITVTGTITHISGNSDCLYLGIDNLSEHFDSNGFEMIPENLAIAKTNGVDTLAIGDTVTFVSAPGLYSNGYSFPIVALSCGDTTFLSFEEGYANFMNVKYHVGTGPRTGDAKIPL